MNENEPKIEITPPEKEKKKKPKLLWKRMEELEEQGWGVIKLEESGPWIQCQTCGEQATWQIDTNQYCNKCMSGKADEFKQAAEEREKKRMEKEKEKPHFDRVVGLPKEKRARQKEVEEILSQKLKDIGGKKIEKLETDKTEKDIEIINFAKDAISEYTKKYTRKKYDIPLQNIHVFNPGGTEEFTEGKFKTGGALTEEGSIVVDRVKSDTKFVACIFHEILHLNSYTALQVKTGKEPSIELYRSGIEIKTRNGEKTLFKDVDEAITALITQRFYQEKIIPSEIFDEEDKKNLLNSRAEERANLEALIDILWNKNKNQFKDKKDIEDLLFEAKFTGNLLKIGKLIEKTLGKGSFRKLGEGNLIKK